MSTASVEPVSVAVQHQQPTMATAPSEPSRDAPKTAKEITTEMFGRFHDFDDSDMYRTYLDRAIAANTANFAVRFGVEKAEIAFDLESQDLSTLLQVQANSKDDTIACTWM